MADVNVSDCNISAKLINWQAGTTQDPGLNLGAAVLAALATRTSNNMDCKGARTIRIPIKLSAGADLTVKVDVHTGTPDFVTPTATLVITDTDTHEIEVDTDATNTFVSVKLETTAGCTIAKAAMLVSGILPAGGGYHEARFGSNGFADNDGTYSIALA
jgi:hypothetical protein